MKPDESTLLALADGVVLLLTLPFEPIMTSPALIRRACLGLASFSLLCAASNALAVEFKSVGNAPAILYDAPTAKGKKMFVAPRGMPVEIVISYGEWSKVRDASGGLAWLEAKSLVNKRNVVITVANAKVRASAEDGALIVFGADKGVLLELLEVSGNGWAKVKHKDGQSGFVKATEVWGE